MTHSIKAHITCCLGWWNKCWSGRRPATADTARIDWWRSSAGPSASLLQIDSSLSLQRSPSCWSCRWQFASCHPDCRSDDCACWCQSCDEIAAIKRKSAKKLSLAYWDLGAISNHLWAHNSNLLKNFFALFCICMIQSGHKFAHVMTAELSWHVKIFDLVG